MKILTSNKDIETELLRLMDVYQEYYWAVAWAGTPEKCFEKLLKNKEKIKQMVFGTHFYQTSPNFIGAFLNFNEVKFREDPIGIFHPKVYFFQNSESEWEAIVGSANFTAAALSNNTEIVVSFSNHDDPKNENYRAIKKVVSDLFNDPASYIYDQGKLEQYIKIAKFLESSKSFIKKGTYINIEMEEESFRQYIVEVLKAHGFDPRPRGDGNISVFPNKDAGITLGFIDFKYEFPEYGYPVARFTNQIDKTVTELNDSRIIIYDADIGSGFLVRNPIPLKDEKYNIGIKDEEHLELLIKILSKRKNDNSINKEKISFPNRDEYLNNNLFDKHIKIYKKLESINGSSLQITPKHTSIGFPYRGSKFIISGAMFRVVTSNYSNSSEDKSEKVTTLKLEFNKEIFDNEFKISVENIFNDEIEFYEGSHPNALKNEIVYFLEFNKNVEFIKIEEKIVELYNLIQEKFEIYCKENKEKLYKSRNLNFFNNDF